MTQVECLCFFRDTLFSIYLMNQVFKEKTCLHPLPFLGTGFLVMCLHRQDSLPFSAIPDIHMRAYSLPTLYSWAGLLVPGRREDNVLTDVVLLFSMMSGSECS